MASPASWKTTALGLAVVGLGVVGTTFAFAGGRDTAAPVAPVSVVVVGEPAVAEPAPFQPLDTTPQPAPAAGPEAGDPDGDPDDDPDDDSPGDHDTVDD